MASVYTISNSNGNQSGPWRETYQTQQAAIDAIAEAQGWGEPVVSERYAVDGGSAVSVYASQEDCDADQDGAFAPRVTKRDVSSACEVQS